MIIRLLIADDHAIMRGGLKQIIATTSDITVAGEASSSTQTLALSRQLAIDLLLLDMMMPGLNGVELIQRLRCENPKLPILILSMNNERQIVSRAIKAGATGYVTKDAHPEVLLAAIRKVAAGGRFVDPSLVETMVFPMMGQDLDVPPHELLSEREFQILKLLVAGHKINDIAAGLHLSPKTVSTYKVRLMQKLDIENNADLIRYAIQHGITPELPPLESSGSAA